MGSNSSKDAINATSTPPQTPGQGSPRIAPNSQKLTIPLKLDMIEETEAPCRLLSLPPEVKNRIYEYVFTVAPTPAKQPRNGVTFLRLHSENKCRFKHSTSSVLNLLETCREINKDAAGIFYDQNNIMLSVYANWNIRDFLATTSAPRLHAVRRLSVLSSGVQQSIELISVLSCLPKLEEIFFYHTVSGGGNGAAVTIDLRKLLRKAQAAVKMLPKVKHVYWNVSWHHPVPVYQVEELRVLEVAIDAELPSNSGRTPVPARVPRGHLSNSQSEAFPANQQGRGSLVSSTNPPILRIVTQRDHEGNALAWEERLNPFFETGPGPETWHRGSPYLPFAETKYIAQAMSDQINADLYGTPGRMAEGNRQVTPPKPRKDMWALPELTQEEKDEITADVKKEFPYYVPDRNH